MPPEESDKIFQNAKIDFADTTVNFGKFHLKGSFKNEEVLKIIQQD